MLKEGESFVSTACAGWGDHDYCAIKTIVKDGKIVRTVYSVGTMLLNHAGTTSVAITFFTVLFFLGPTMGYAPMFAGINFFMCGSTPVLAMLCSAFLIATMTPRLSFKQGISGFIPAFIYGILYVSLAVFTHV